MSYLQPAETRPGLVEAIATTPGVAPYFDLSFQHASEPVLRRMRRFGSTKRFLELLASVRDFAPEAGARSNVIVGFPGETRADMAELERFLTEARLDAIGVFDYSDEDGTEAAGLSPARCAPDTIARRFDRVSALAEELCNQRAEERVGSQVDVLVESVPRSPTGGSEGREVARHQAPEVDGSTTLVGGRRRAVEVTSSGRGSMATDGVDLVAVPVEVIDPAPRLSGRPMSRTRRAATSGVGGPATGAGPRAGPLVNCRQRADGAAHRARASLRDADGRLGDDPAGLPDRGRLGVRASPR